MSRYGWQRIKKSLKRRFAERTVRRDYRQWLKLHGAISAGQRAEMLRRIELFAEKPLISVILPVYNVEERWLRMCIQSVFDQVYENWELCIADDCSPSPHIKRVLEEFAIFDSRVKIVFRQKNGHISAASNSALALADGDFCALLDHDDVLSEDAFFHIAREINEFPDVDFIYSDEDMIDENGVRYMPKFKPDFSLDLLYSVNYLTHLAVYRTAVLRAVNGWREGLEGSQDYDLALRFIEQIPENRVRHIPRILYHWRAISGSVALDSGEKPYAHERAREAIRSHLKRTGKKAAVSRTVYNLHRVQYDLPPLRPKVSLILLADEDFTATEKSVRKFIEATDYQNLEIVPVCSSAAKKNFNAGLAEKNVTVIISEEKSEAGKYNAAVEQTSGEILCFVNLNLHPISKDWLNELVGFAIQNEIGAVGAKILSADETILHGGFVLGVGDVTASAHAGFSREAGGNLGRAQIINNFSATAIDCLATRREIFQTIGGFDAGNFPNKLFDADFCLRLREKNLRVVWTPYAELVQNDKQFLLNLQKEPNHSEREMFKQKWQMFIESDPFYNPNFSRGDANFKINNLNDPTLEK